MYTKNLAVLTFDIVVCVACFDFVSSGAHGELVNTHVAGPSVSDVDLSVQNFTLWLLQKEGIEIILHRIEVCTWFIAHSGEENGILGISIRHDARVSSGESGVPQIEQRANFFLCNRVTGFGVSGFFCLASTLHGIHEEKAKFSGRRIGGSPAPNLCKTVVQCGRCCGRDANARVGSEGGGAIEE